MPYDARAELRGILDVVGDAIVITDQHWRILNINGTCATLFGFEAHELIGQSVGRLLVARGQQQLLASLRQAFAGRTRRHGLWQGQLRGRHKDGHPVILGGRVGCLLQNGLVRYVLVLRDDSNRRRVERKLRQAASHDPLTGLLNRAAFSAELQRAIERAERHADGFGLLLLDLDHFKEINDSAGHPAGDLLLRQVVRRLRAQVRRSEVLARLGGDEFAVILEDSDTIPSIALAERLVSALAPPFHVAGVDAQTGASVGIAMFPRDAHSADQLLSCADLAMYAAKTAGGARWHLYDPHLQDVASARRTLEGELRTALRDGQLGLVYQPVLRTGDLTVCGFEALIRWNHPSGRMLRPEAFIPLAERSRLIQPITEWAVRRALADASTLPPAIGGLDLAVNISTGLFDQDHLVEIVEQVCGRTGAPGCRLILEIAEAALAECEHAAVTLGTLRELGIGIAIDDFGAGFSSLGRLKGLPLDVLKIDRSFVACLPDSAADRAIVDAVARLAASLGIVTVAEGVETLDQLSAVIGLGCSQVQGFLLAAPMAIREVPAWLRTWQRSERARMLALGTGRADRSRKFARLPLTA